MLLAQDFACFIHLKLTVYNKLVQNYFHIPKHSSYEIKCSNVSSKTFRYIFHLCIIFSFVLLLQTCWYLKYGDGNPAVTIQSLLYTFVNILNVIIALKFYKMRYQLTYLFNNMLRFEIRHNGN